MSIQTPNPPDWKDVILYKTPENHAFYCPTPGKITLLALTPNKIGFNPEEQLFSELVACGFNAAALWYNKVKPSQLGICSEIETALNRCGNSNLALFFYTPTLKENSLLRNLMVSYYSKMSSQHFAGWYLTTPKYSDIYNETQNTPGIIANVYNTIWNVIMSQTTDNVHCKHFIIMNVFANKDSAGADYRDYLMKYQENVKPSMWGTAVYPAVTLAAGKFNDYNLFFSDLEILSLISRYCRRPFWYTIRCQSYKTPNGAFTPYPNVEEMRFAALSALAYGAQGLEYWSYRQRENEPNVTYQEAPIYRDGTKNNTVWNAVRTVNEEIMALNDIFFNAYLVKLRHTSKQYGCTSLLEKGMAFGPLVSIETGDEGVLISHLNTHGEDYLIIVNHVFREGEADNQTIYLAFNNECSLHKIEVSNGCLNMTTLTARHYQINLPRGGYLIYKWS